MANSYQLPYGQVLSPPSTAGQLASSQTRFGQQGQGDAGTGAAVGTMVGQGMQAAAGFASMILQGANNPFQVGKEFSRKFERGVQNLRALDAEYTRFRNQHDNAVAWLTHPANKKEWMRGAEALRVAPPGSRLCPPIYLHGVGRAAVGEESAPGGFAGAFPFGDPLCRCPTSKCAFKLQVRGMVDDKKRVAREAEGKMERILTSRGLGLGAYLGAMDVTRTGNLTQGRGTVQGAWSILMALDSLSPLYVMAGAQAPPLPPNLITPGTLTLLYPNDVDAQAGRVPIEVRTRTINTALGLYGMGGIPPAFTLPLWAYGFTPEDVRRHGIGPNIGQVAELQIRGTGGRSLSDRISNVIKSGMSLTQIPVAPPSDVPNTQIADLQAQIEEQQQLQKKLPLPVKIGIGAAVASIAAWGLLSLNKD